jgi:hypothetical protein
VRQCPAASLIEFAANPATKTLFFLKLIGYINYGFIPGISISFIAVNV